MRIYQPKNELGQNLLNEGQLVSSSTSITKSLTGGAITLTDSDVAGIANWIVKSVYCTIKGQEMSFSPEVSYGLDGITLRFSHDGENIEGLTGAKISLQLVNAQGLTLGGNELVIDVLIREALSSGDNTKVDAYVDEVIATGDKEQIQSLGVKLASSGIEEYTLAGAKTVADAKQVMTTGVGNLGAFSQPIATLVNEGNYNESLVLNDTDFGYNMMSLENGSKLFYYSNITSFDGKISSLANASSMFYGCSGLTSWTIALPESLTTANSMFLDCTGLTSWTVALPESLTDVSYMFRDCTGLTSWTVALPESLTDASGMFLDCTGLTSWTVALPESLTNASYMFRDCTGFTSWTVALPKSLTNASGMFYGCSGLTSWTIALPESLTNASYMFRECTGFTSWTVALPESLTNAQQMFYGCTNLTSFTPWGNNEDGTPKDTGTTGNLSKGYQMFHNCKLDLASVKRIADWLPQRTSAKPTGSESSSKDGWIHIGVASGVNTGDEFNTAISKITGKKWSVVICVNGAHTTK